MSQRPARRADDSGMVDALVAPAWLSARIGSERDNGPLSTAAIPGSRAARAPVDVVLQRGDEGEGDTAAPYAPRGRRQL